MLTKKNDEKWITYLYVTFLIRTSFNKVQNKLWNVKLENTETRFKKFYNINIFLFQPFHLTYVFFPSVSLLNSYSIFTRYQSEVP